jgi:transformation/transcription domain-associated protein
LKISWFEKLFATLDSPQVNNPNICTALELLTFLIGIQDKTAVLENMKNLQKGIAACMTCQNGKVIRAVHHLMTRLTGIFPTEFPGSSGASTVQKYDELEPLYTTVSKVIYEGLNTYEKMSNANPQTLFGPLMMCKAACANSPGYIDRIIIPFMKCLQKLSREHLSPAVNDAVVATELLTLSLDLVKNRVGVMGVEMRKAFIGTILVSLIEKSTDTKVMQTIIKMLDEWVKNKSPQIVNQAPSIREKSILLVKLMQNVEKRFPNDQELIGLFLELINFIYRDENLKSTELNSKLEPAFLSGLRCTQPLIREKFFQVFDGSIRRKLHERLLYIVCSQNWEAMGPHFWIKQCEELLLATASDVALEVSRRDCLIPPITFGYSLLDHVSKEIMFSGEPDCGPELREIEKSLLQEVEKDLEKLETVDDSDDAMLTEIITKLEDGFINEGCVEPAHPDKNMKSILSKERDFFQYVRKGYTTSSLIKPLIQLCHYDTTLAEKIWISFFPRAWKIFSEKQQLALANEMVPFLCSGVHVIQQNCQPSAMSTFVESLCQCVPSIPIKP